MGVACRRVLEHMLRDSTTRRRLAKEFDNAPINMSMAGGVLALLKPITKVDAVPAENR
jgi:hypothetical protein